MELELQYASASDIPKGFEALYTEKDGKFNLTGVKGLSALQALPASVTRLETSLKAEREAHKKTKEGNGDTGTKIAELEAQLAEAQATLEANGKKIDDKVLADLADKRSKPLITAAERAKAAAEAKVAEVQAQLDAALGRERQGKISLALGEVAAKAGLPADAQEIIKGYLGGSFEVAEDGSVRTKDGGLFPVGLDPAAALNEAKAKFPSLWPTSQGGGAKGGGFAPGGGPNPFTKANWNVTEQMKLSDADAERLARAAGVDPKNPKPPEK